MKYTFKTFRVTLASENWDLGKPLNCSEDIFNFAKSVYATLDADKEHFIVIVCNNKYRVQGFKVISTGCLTSTVVHIREVFMAVLNPDWRAAAVAFLHNHPSGDPAPSPEDIDLTKRIKEIADVLGVRVLDHVVVGHERFFSFNEKGML